MGARDLGVSIGWQAFAGGGGFGRQRLQCRGIRPWPSRVCSRVIATLQTRDTLNIPPEFFLFGKTGEGLGRLRAQGLKKMGPRKEGLYRAATVRNRGASSQPMPTADQE